MYRTLRSATFVWPVYIHMIIYVLVFLLSKKIISKVGLVRDALMALKETRLSVRERLQYYRRTALGLACRVKGMGFTNVRLESLSSWKHYCPVTLSLQNELVPSYDWRCAVEYQGKVSGYR